MPGLAGVLAAVAVDVVEHKVADTRLAREAKVELQLVRAKVLRRRVSS
jgi:hypothetical protein